MSATRVLRYDHPSFQVVHQSQRQLSVAATGVQKAATFRSALKAIVTNIYAMVESAGTASAILTLLFNASIAAILTLGNTANQNIVGFTLTANRTMDTLADFFQVSVGNNATGEIAIVYQYHIVPQDMTTFGTNLI